MFWDPTAGPERGRMRFKPEPIQEDEARESQETSGNGSPENFPHNDILANTLVFEF